MITAESLLLLLLLLSLLEDVSLSFDASGMAEPDNDSSLSSFPSSFSFFCLKSSSSDSSLGHTSSSFSPCKWKRAVPGIMPLSNNSCSSLNTSKCVHVSISNF